MFQAEQLTISETKNLLLEIDDYNLDLQKTEIKNKQDHLRSQMSAIQQQINNFKAFKAAYKSKKSMEDFYTDIEKISFET